jgi:hypothetical protein
MKTAADFMVAVAAALYSVQWQNRQCSFRHEGSGYVPADFQADKTHIIVPGPVLVEGRRNRLCRHTIVRLLMAAKASRRSVSLTICRIRLRWIFFCFREAADHLLSQAVLMNNWEGVA